jgi:hypothetical protein
MRRIYPVTTGGTTIGRCRIASKTPLPAKFFRARSQPKIIPKGRLPAADDTPTIRLNFAASASAGVRKIIGYL